MELPISILEKEVALYEKSDVKSAELYRMGEITQQERYIHKTNLGIKIKQLEQAIKILKDERAKITGIKKGSGRG